MPAAIDTSVARKLGTFGGVFVPNVLTILGVIMFLRTGWVVGHAGLFGALAILLVAKVITLLTSLSLAAISTNSRVGAGGAYFLISRSLGLEIGGSIGVPLFFAQAISVAFYLVGFTESLTFLMPDVDARLVSTIGLVVFMGVAWFGAGLVAKAQYVILVLLVVSLVSMFGGFRINPGAADNLWPDPSSSIGFWAVFAIFFPAVTGIMAGVSMSGDLRDPSRSIPRGTILAVLVTMGIYAAQIVFLALASDRETLKSNALVLVDLALLPSLIYVGLWAATLSSALASLAAAPRTLQALAEDGVVPRLLRRGMGNSREPHAALLVTFVVAEACILVGDLDLIAPIITMFFLATYGTINVVAGIERLVSNPSYRPTFRTHWLPSLLGGAGCLSVMCLINTPATILAILVIGATYVVLTRARLEAAWGDVRSGLWFTITRFGLLRYVSSRQHVRNWRPVLLVLAGNPRGRAPMVEFAQCLEARRGFLFLAQIVTGDWAEFAPRQRKLQAALRTYIADNRLSAVPRAIVADDFEHGVATLLQVSGTGQFEPNTVLIGWSDDAVKEAQFGRVIEHILQFERNLIVYADADDDQRDALKPVIDIWWYARGNGTFMLTLAYLLCVTPEWRHHRIRVLRIIRDEAGAAEARAGTEAIVREFRVDADVEVIVSKDEPHDVIARTSYRSAVCFVGLSTQSLEAETSALAPYARLVARLDGRVILAKSWHDLEF
ncbi:MAG: hypothetical protein KDA25_03325 [Phycisphaerales bacterium]|nr:hypothetical protein [Phycisphaerales bacterium]